MLLVFNDWRALRGSREVSVTKQVREGGMAAMFCWGARRLCVDQGGFPATGGRGAGRRAQTSSCCSPGGVSDAEVVNSERFQFTPTRVFLLFWCRLRETRRLVPTPCFSEGLSFSSQRTREWISLLGLPEWKLCCPLEPGVYPKADKH